MAPHDHSRSEPLEGEAPRSLSQTGPGEGKGGSREGRGGIEGTEGHLGRAPWRSPTRGSWRAASSETSSGRKSRWGRHPLSPCSLSRREVLLLFFSPHSDHVFCRAPVAGMAGSPGATAQGGPAISHVPLWHCPGTLQRRHFSGSTQGPIPSQKCPFILVPSWSCPSPSILHSPPPGIRSLPRGVGRAPGSSTRRACLS